MFVPTGSKQCHVLASQVFKNIVPFPQSFRRSREIAILGTESGMYSTKPCDRSYLEEKRQIVRMFAPTGSERHHILTSQVFKNISFFPLSLRKTARTSNLIFRETGTQTSDQQLKLPFFLSSGLPFLTVATNMSPTPAAGSLFKRPLTP